MPSASHCSVRSPPFVTTSGLRSSAASIGLSASDVFSTTSTAHAAVPALIAVHVTSLASISARSLASSRAPALPASVFRPAPPNPAVYPVPDSSLALIDDAKRWSALNANDAFRSMILIVDVSQDSAPLATTSLPLLYQADAMLDLLAPHG